MATVKVTSINSEDFQRIKNEVEDLLEVLGEQEDKLGELYDLEAAIKVLAASIVSMVHAVSETNEELYRHAREIRVLIKPESN